MPDNELQRLQGEYEEKRQKDHESKVAWRIGSERPHPWIDFQTTDPKQHNSHNYRYLVHAVRPYDYLKPKELVKYFYQKPTVSMSLITNDISETFYKAGFILKVPPGNIVSARPHGSAAAILNDKSTQEEFKRAILEANDIWGVWSPEDLIRYTRIDRSGNLNGNEVYAITGYEYSSLPKIEIAGVFYQSKAKPKPTESIEIAKEFTRLLNVPMVKL
mgnify:FL=1